MKKLKKYQEKLNDLTKKIKKIKKTLFISDVHGCSEELKKLVDKVKPTRIILLGDLFKKGPHPKEVF